MYEFKLFWSGRMTEYILSVKTLMNAGHTREEAEWIFEEIKKDVERDVNIEKWISQRKDYFGWFNND